MAHSSLRLLPTPIHPFPRQSPNPVRPAFQLLARAAAQGSAPPKDERVVIVGAGIAGLATAVSLHRLGVESLVLEQSDSLRKGGTSLTLFKNGWRVLDSIGVGAELRRQFLEIEGMDIRTETGRELRAFTFKDEVAGQEVRAVERAVLLEALASQLPPKAIRFSSRLEGIQREADGRIMLELEGGERLLAKTVIGCDGVRSQIAKWMGFSEPQYVGHVAFRGLGVYPGGQPFKPKVNYFYGRGIRAGCVPVSQTKVYWFICFNKELPGPKVTDPSTLKNEAKRLVENWSADLLDVIERTADASVIKTPLVDRWLWPGVTPAASDGPVVLVGDAWHPMTPNLGQGACCALEDAVTLSMKLATALQSNQNQDVLEALSAYGKERWGRVFPLTVRANLVGALLQWDNPIVCAIRDGVLVPKVVRMAPLLEHTNFECDLLDPVGATGE